jgi:hypothetical protein
MKCDTSNCENEGIVDVGNMVVCGRCHHGMLHGEKPVTMSEAAYRDARQLVADWCDPKPPNGWAMPEPGVIEDAGGTDRWLDVRSGELRPLSIPLDAVDVALRSMNVGSSVALVRALEAALEDGDALRGVIARAIEASDTIADSDAEDVVQEMLQILMEPEPVGGDDRLDELLELRGRVESQAAEWRAELDKRHLGVMLMVGQIVGADADDDPIELLRARMKELAEFDADAARLRGERDEARRALVTAVLYTWVGPGKPTAREYAESMYPGHGMRLFP